jgi:radical SAM/Cys-rich protein
MPNKDEVSADKPANRFERRVLDETGACLRAESVDTFQVNVGLRCNQACAHCHLGAGPDRPEQMSWATMRQVVDAAQRAECELVDITGGAPELHPRLREFIASLRDEGLRVQMRSNLTAMLLDQDLPRFLREHNVHIVGSLPCYLEENVRDQRGEGVYDRSVEAVRRLNDLGYGAELPLQLVYNPVGPSLPPNQEELEADYRRELRRRFGIEFSGLLTITNMPLGRFRARLRYDGEEQEYYQLLMDAFNPATLDGLMCRRQVSVAWDGTLYDCDFNLSLGWPVDHGVRPHVSAFEPGLFARRRIVTGDHCFGCTAGHGSSCGGALA